MLVGKVEAYINRYRLLAPGDRVLVAVSGGPDSLALLHLLRSLAPRFKVKLAVAHLDHRFRPEALKEALAVGRLAGHWGLPFFGASLDVPCLRRRWGVSSQEAARKARYRFLLSSAGSWGAGKIALGHQLDDQVETVLLNFLRGTGVDGLCGMVPERRLGKCILIRPLLGVSRKEIEEYCRDHRLQPFTDPSNLTGVYTRNKIRLELIPYLQENYNPRLREALIRLSQLAAADRQYLQQAAVRELQKISCRQGNRLILDARSLDKLPAALKGRVSRLALFQVSPPGEVGWKQVQQLIDLCRGCTPAAELQLPGGGRVYRSCNRLIFAPAPVTGPAVAVEATRVNIPGETALPWANGKIIARLTSADKLNWPPSSREAYLDIHRLPETLWVRTRWPGARFHPQGSGGSKKLKDFFIDQKIPRHLRDRWPLVAAGEDIVWVVGKRIGNPYRITAGTTGVAVLKFVPFTKDCREFKP